MAVHVFTTVTANYLPKARVLARSVKRFLPGSVFHVQLVDAIPEDFDLKNEPFDSLMGLRDFGLKRPEQWLFKHSLVEACTGVKGFALKRLLARRPDCSAVLYFDPDIVVLAPLEKLVARFQSASVLLTPHLTEPETALEAILDNEFSVLQHGIYNLGFLGVNNSPEGRLFADWWANRLENFCYDDIPRGLFTDQRWADLAPAYFPGVQILRDSGYNVCTWNLTHRHVDGNLRDGFSASGEPLYFYHFSGLDSGAQRAMLDKYGSKMPALYELRAWYLAECDRMGQRQHGNAPWPYDFFDNGERITALHRKRYRERADLQDAFPNPFSTSDINNSYYHWFEADEGRTLAVAASQPWVELRACEPENRRRAADHSFDPFYRIYLSVCRTELDAAIKAITNLAEKTYRLSDLYVLGPQHILDSLQPVVPTGGSLQMVAVPESSSHEDAFAIVAASSSGQWDFIFVTAAVVVPELWDLRLAWTAKRVDGAASISPVSDQSAATGLGLGHSLQSVDALDGACYHYSQFWNPEIPEFLLDCSYINGKALSDLMADGLGQVTFQRCGERFRRLRWSQVLADHIYTGVQDDSKTAPASAVSEPLASLCGRMADHFAAQVRAPLSPVGNHAMRRQLHIMHSWGGGLERWVREYCHADLDHENLILKSSGTWGAFGLELQLYRHIDDTNALRSWLLSPPIKHTHTTHFGYQAALAEIIDEYGIDAVFISSLIGHSLEALNPGVPVVMVCHDFYPFCPALNITFHSVCHRCTQQDLMCCTESNPHHRFFRNVPPAEWIKLRKNFTDSVLRWRVPMIAPAPSVRSHYIELLPELTEVFRIVPHGVRAFESGSLRIDHEPDHRLRVAILGSLAPHKGLDLLKAIQDQLRSFAQIFLIGGGEYSQSFEGLAGVTVVPQYRWEQLPGLLQSIQPDLGLLLSIIPETFSYTLQELMNLAIPPLATRMGSFTDYIDDGVTGFLADPEPGAVLARLRELDGNRKALATVHEALKQRSPRGLQNMIMDYEALLGLPSLSGRAYFAPDTRLRRSESPMKAFQVMWRNSDGDFSESASTRCRIAVTGVSQLVRMTVPPLSHPPVQLRLDLGEEPGFLVILHVRLHTSANDCIWYWDSREGFMQGPKSGIQILGSSQGLLVYLSDNDPHWLLPIEAGLDALTAGGWIEVKFCYPGLHGITSGNLGSRTGRDANSERLLHQLTDVRARVADLEGSLSWRVTGPLRQIAALALKLVKHWHGNSAVDHWRQLNRG